MDEYEVFTGDPSIGESGIIADPILVVQDNYRWFDYLEYFSSGIIFEIYDPLNPYETIRPILEKYDLTDSIKTTPTVYSRYAEELEKNTKELAKNIFKWILILTVLILMIINNIVVLYSLNKERFSIKKNPRPYT